MIYRFFLTTIFLISLSLSGFSQLSYIPLSVDYASFTSSTDNILLEVYLSFRQEHLRYVENDSGFTAQVIAKTEIFSNDSLVISYNKQYGSSITSLDEVRSKHQMIDVYFFELPAGQYKANIKVNDVYSKSSGEYVFNFDLTPYKIEELSLSDIELCTQIVKDTTHSRFRKGHLQVIPNPSSLYGISLPILYYYAEAYNLAYTDNEEGTFRQETYITDNEGGVVKVISDEIKQKPGSSSIIAGGSNITGLPGNTYFFNLRVTDQQTGKIVRKAKRFSLLKPSREPEADTVMSKESSQNPLLMVYMNYNEEKLDREFEQLKYIASDEEKNIYPNLDTEKKRQFLVDFWKRRDSNPQTDENEYRDKYLQRLESAAQYSRGNREGWRTDRGRVLLLYGIPDNIERYPNRVGNKPYEIWTYTDIEGGCIFVFADLMGFGDYELVHSTHPREFKQPNWMDLITPGSSRDN